MTSHGSGGGANGNGDGSGSSAASTGSTGGHVRSHYEVLDVAHDANEEELDDAYLRALSLIEGSSIGGYLMLDPSAMDGARHEVEAAYDVLRDQKRRAAFDKSIGLRSPVHNAKTVSGRPMSLRFLAPVEDPPVASAAEPPDAAPAPGAPKKDEAPPALAAVVPAAPAKVESEPEVSESQPATFIESAPPALITELAEGEEVNGQVIRRLREGQGLTIDEVCKKTHIRKAYLLAIEEMDVAELPAPVYLRGFLTQIARVLKVDKKRLSEGYLAFVTRYLE